MVVEERRGRRWTEREDEVLGFYWGVVDATTLATRMGRTAWGCETRARKLGLGHPGRGHETLKQFCERTGYTDSTVMLAARRLDVHLSRRARSAQSRPKQVRGRLFAIDSDLADLLISELTSRPDGRRQRGTYRGEWGHGKPLRCVSCNRSDRPHCARGVCAACYQRLYVRAAKSTKEV